MASKSNIRSIRISDKMAELIDQQAGNNFTEKWENLVTRCVWELPAQEERLSENLPGCFLAQVMTLDCFDI